MIMIFKFFNFLKFLSFFHFKINEIGENFHVSHIRLVSLLVSCSKLFTLKSGILVNTDLKLIYYSYI